jgi:hypothetical protein
MTNCISIRFPVKSLLIIAVLLIMFCTELLPNIYSLIVNRGYFIPEESSIFTFRATLDNPGSGEWWIYGEDNKNCYYAAVEPYAVISKNNHCPGFNKLDYRTWCTVAIREHKGIPE